MKRTNDAWSPSMNVGTPNTPYCSTHSVCSAASVFSGRPLVASSATASGSRPGRGDRVAQHVFVLELLAVLVARREQREVRVEELVGEGVAHRDAVQQREDSRAPLLGLALPHRRLALFDVHLVERERHEPEVEVADPPTG